MGHHDVVIYLNGLVGQGKIKHEKQFRQTPAHPHTGRPKRRTTLRKPPLSMGRYRRHRNAAQKQSQRRYVRKNTTPSTSDPSTRWSAATVQDVDVSCPPTRPAMLSGRRAAMLEDPNALDMRPKCRQNVQIDAHLTSRGGQTDDYQICLGWLHGFCRDNAWEHLRVG